MKKSQKSKDFGKIAILQARNRELEEDLSKCRNANMCLRLKIKKIKDIYLKYRHLTED
jgi:hypothetical protein